MKNFLYSLLIIFPLQANIKDKIAPNLVFHQSQETLSQIIKIIAKQEKGAYLRFGDGEVNIASRTGQSGHQNFHPALQKEMAEALALEDPNILRSLPLHCKELGGWEPSMFPGNHEWPYQNCINFINKIKHYWSGPLRNVYSPVALHIASTNHQNFAIRFLKFLRESNCTVFVGNRNVPIEIKNLLFGERCTFIPTPPYNAYSNINQIEQMCTDVINKSNKYQVIISAAGVMGRALQKRLWHKYDNIFLFDFGSLIDGLVGWQKNQAKYERAWITLTHFNPQIFIKKLKNQKVKVLYTAALIENKFEYRKKEYLESLNTLFSIGYKPYIVDACTQTNKSFFEEYCDTVLYAGTNNITLYNKGVNEIKSLIAACNHYQFNDEDMIIKITGRYTFDS